MNLRHDISERILLIIPGVRDSKTILWSNPFKICLITLCNIPKEIPSRTFEEIPGRILAWNLPYIPNFNAEMLQLFYFGNSQNVFLEKSCMDCFRKWWMNFCLQGLDFFGENSWQLSLAHLKRFGKSRNTLKKHLKTFERVWKFLKLPDASLKPPIMTWSTQNAPEIPPETRIKTLKTLSKSSNPHLKRQYNSKIPWNPLKLLWKTTSCFWNPIQNDLKPSKTLLNSWTPSQALKHHKTCLWDSVWNPLQHA